MSRFLSRTRNNPRRLNISLAAAVVLVIAPFILLNLWNHPSADDFSYATYVAERGFWPNQAWYFLHWAGRYVANLVTSLTPIVLGLEEHTVTPLALTLYRIASLVMVVLFCHALWRMLRSLNRCVLQISQTTMTALYLVILTTLLITLPSPAELFYWYPASVAYCLPFIALFWMVALWLRWLNEPLARARAWLLAAIVGLLLVQIGSQEMSLMAAVITVAALSVLSYRSLRRTHRLHSLAWIIAPMLIAATIAATAPGNFARKAIWVERGGELPFAERFTAWSIDLVTTLGQMLTQTRLLALLLVTLPLITLAAIALAKRYRRPPNPLWSLALLLAYWVGISLPGLAASADELLGAGRTQNTYSLLLVLSVFILLTHLIWYTVAKSKRVPVLIAQITRAKLAWAMWLLLIVLIAGWILISPKSNVSVAWRNVLSGSAARYDQQLLERYALIKKSSDVEVTVPKLIDTPVTLFFDDITDDPKDWRNTSYARFFAKQSIIAQ